MHGKDVVEHPPIEITFVPFGWSAHEIEGAGHRPRDLLWHDDIAIAFRGQQKLEHSSVVRAHVRTEHGIHGKARIGFVVPKHAVMEEFVGLLDLLAGVALIIDEADPGADARKRPHIELDPGLGEPLEDTDMQPGRRSAAGERDRAFHRLSPQTCRPEERNRTSRLAWISRPTTTIASIRCQFQNMQTRGGTRYS